MTLTPDPVKCPYCAGFHVTVCSLIKAIEFYENGNIKRVELKTANDYPPVISQYTPGTLYGGGDGVMLCTGPLVLPESEPPKCGWDSDGEHTAIVFMYWDDLEDLSEYSTSIPTGTTIGKRWKADYNARRYPEQRTPYDDWHLCEYTDIGRPDKVGISRKRIVILTHHDAKHESPCNQV